MLTVVKLGGSHAAATHLRPWLRAIEQAAGRVVLVPGGGAFADAVRTMQPLMGFDDGAAHDMALLAMVQYGRALVSLGCHLVLAEDVAAIRSALGARRVPVWSPMTMLHDAPDVPHSWAVTSDSLALYLARVLAAGRVVLVKHRAAEDADLPALVQAGLVDAAFPVFRAAFAGNVRIVGPDDVFALA